MPSVWTVEDSTCKWGAFSWICCGFYWSPMSLDSASNAERPQETALFAGDSPAWPYKCCQSPTHAPRCWTPGVELAQTGKEKTWNHTKRDKGSASAAPWLARRNADELLSIASRSRTGRKKAGLGGRRGDRVKLGIKKDLFIIKSVWSCPSFLEVPRAYNHESVWMKSQALLEGFNFLDTAHFSHIVLDMQIL